MTSMATKAYPDLEPLFALRLQGRIARARLTLGEKLEILEELRAGAAAFKANRQEPATRAACA